MIEGDGSGMLAVYFRTKDGFPLACLMVIQFNRSRACRWANGLKYGVGLRGYGATDKSHQKSFQNRLQKVPKAMETRPKSDHNRSKCDFRRFWGVMGRSKCDFGRFGGVMVRRVGPRLPKARKGTPPFGDFWAQTVTPRVD